VTEPGNPGAARRHTTAAVIVPLTLLVLGLAFALVPLAQGRMFFYWDNAQQHYAQTVFLGNGLHQGTIPQWWPNVGLGFPTTAEGQSAHYHPIRLVCAALFSASAAMMWELALYFAIAGLSTYGFLRQFRVGRFAALFGGIAQMFCGFAVIYVRNLALHRSLCLLPLAMLFAERFARTQSGASLAGAVVVTGVQFLAGHPSMAIVTTVATTVHVVLRALQEARRHPAKPGRLAAVVSLRLAAWLVAAGLGLGLAGIQSVPTLRHAEQSQRQGGLNFEFASGSEPAHVRGLGQLLFPYTYEQGDWLAQAASWGRYNSVPSSGLYAGVLCVLLAPLSLWWRRRWPDPAATLATGGLVAVGFALGAVTPLFPTLWSLPGMNGLRFPSRFLIWAAFCLSCLAALGLQRLTAMTRVPRRRIWLLTPIVILTLGLLALAAVRWRMDPTLGSRIALSLGWFAAGLSVIVCVLVVPRRLQAAALILASVVTVSDLLFFRAHGGYARTVAIDQAVAPPPHVDFLRRDPDQFRVMSLIKTDNGAFEHHDLTDFVMADLCTIWGIDSSDVFLSLFLRRYYAVHQSLVQELLARPHSAPQLAGFLGALNVKYVVAPGGLILAGWQRVHTAGPTSLWQNPRVLPRAYLVHRAIPQRFELQDVWRIRSDERLADYAQTVSDWASRQVDAQILDHVTAAQVDYATTAEVGDLEQLSVQPVDGSGTVQAHLGGTDELRFTVSATTPAFLVVSNSWYPGWTATVNGHTARLHQVNWVTMGLPVPAGASEVVLRYETPGLGAGRIASLAVLALVITTILGFPTRRMVV